MDATSPIDPEVLLAHGAFLRRLARGMLGDEHEAEDVVQEAYAAALTSSSAGRVSLPAWLRGTVRNLARRSRRARRRRVFREEAVARSRTGLSPVDETVARLELQRRVVQEVTALSEPGRTALVLRYYDGLGPAEIARRLGCPVRTAESRLRRAREDLRRRLDASCGSRRAWVLGILSWAREGPAAGGPAAVVGAAVVGALAMKTKIAAAAALLLLLGGAAAIVLGPAADDRRAPEDRGETTAESAAVGPRLEGAPEAGTASDPVAATATGAASLRGTVSRAGRPARARVEVRDLGGRNLTNASLLQAFYGAGPPIAAADTDADGRFRIEGLAPGRYEVTAHASDGAVAWERAFPNPHWQVHLELLAGDATLEAAARYADGRPFRGLVSIGAPSQGSGYLPEVETDAEGRFARRGIPAGTCTVAFILPGRWRSWFTVDVPLPAGHVFVVDEGLTRHRVTVLADDSGEPIAGAEVFARGEVGPGARSHASSGRTDEGGRLEVLLPAKEALFWVEREGFETLQVSRAWEDPIVLRLSRQGTLTGRVVDAAKGTPVAGVPVHGWNWHTFAMKSPLATSDEGGRFTARVGPGKGMVYALGRGWVEPRLSDLTDESVNRTLVEVGQGGTKDVLLQVVAAGRAEGVLLDEDGRPVPGVFVALQHPEGWKGFSQTFLHGEVSNAVTAADGRFTLENLIPAFPYRVAALPPRGLPARSAVVSARSGETVRVDLRLPEARSLTVRLLERETRRPVVGAQVGASQGPTHSVSAETGEDGTARLEPLLPEPVRLWARHPEYLLRGPDLRSAEEGRSWDLPAPGKDAETHEIEVERAAFVAGRVLEADGRTPRESGWIGVYPVGEPRGRSLGLTGLAPLGREGTFRAGPVPPGTYDLILLEGKDLFQTRQASRWTVATGDGEVALRIDPSKAERDEDRFGVHVLGPDGGPVGGFVRLLGRTGVLAEMSALREGRFSFGPVVPEAEVWVELRSPAEGKTPLGGHLHGPVPLVAGEIEIRLPAPRTLRGRVLAPGGEPVSGVRVHAAPALPEVLRASASSFALAATRTDAQGAFALPAGDAPVEILVQAPSSFALSPVPPVPAGTGEVEVRLEVGEDVELTVVDEAGEPIEGAAVAAALPAVPWLVRSGTTDARGVVLLEGLSSRQAYGLSVDPPPLRGDLGGEREESWRPTSRRVVLARGDPVQGTVRSRTAFVSSAVVWWRVPAGPWRRLVTGVQGTFSFTPPAGSEVLLRAAREGATRIEAAGPEVRASAGSRGVVVRVPD